LKATAEDIRVGSLMNCYLTAKTVFELSETLSGQKNFCIMPCFTAIAKDAYGNEGKMWENCSIVEF